MGNMTYMRTLMGIDIAVFAFDGVNESRAIMDCEFNSLMEIYDNIRIN